MKQYKIRAGFSFVGDDKVVKGGGETVTLADDVAELHAHKLEVVQTSAQRKPAKAAADTSKTAEADKPADAAPPAADPVPAADGAAAGEDAGKAE